MRPACGQSYAGLPDCGDGGWLNVGPPGDLMIRQFLIEKGTDGDAGLLAGTGLLPASRPTSPSTSAPAVGSEDATGAAGGTEAAGKRQLLSGRPGWVQAV